MLFKCEKQYFLFYSRIVVGSSGKQRSKGHITRIQHISTVRTQITTMSLPSHALKTRITFGEVELEVTAEEMGRIFSRILNELFCLEIKTRLHKLC